LERSHGWGGAPAAEAARDAVRPGGRRARCSARLLACLCIMYFAQCNAKKKLGKMVGLTGDGRDGMGLDRIG
jgi:hypothetical protein